MFLAKFRLWYTPSHPAGYHYRRNRGGQKNEGQDGRHSSSVKSESINNIKKMQVTCRPNSVKQTEHICMRIEITHSESCGEISRPKHVPPDIQFLQTVQVGSGFPIIMRSLHSCTDCRQMFVAVHLADHEDQDPRDAGLGPAHSTCASPSISILSHSSNIRNTAP